MNRLDVLLAAMFILYTIASAISGFVYIIQGLFITFDNLDVIAGVLFLILSQVIRQTKVTD